METKRRDLIYQFLSRALLMDMLTGAAAQNYIPANALIHFCGEFKAGYSLVEACNSFLFVQSTPVQRRGSLLKGYSVLKSEFSTFHHVVGQTLRMKRCSLKQH